MTSPFLSSRLDDAARTKLLDDVLLRAGARGSTRPVVVFDLDGTLMDNRPRVVAILHALSVEWRERHPEDADRCARATSDDIVYGFIENLRRLGVTDEALHEQGFIFWKDRFFTDPHQRHDIEVEGAHEFAVACHAAGANIVYLTGRDLPKMALGSFASLRDLGFPIGVVGTELVVKPTFDMPDLDFKRSVLPELSRLGDVIAVFDNEPANVNLFYDLYPAITGVFLDTQFAPNPPKLDPRAHVIHHFGRRLESKP